MYTVSVFLFPQCAALPVLFVTPFGVSQACACGSPVPKLAEVLYDGGTVPTSRNCLTAVRRAGSWKEHPLVPVYSPPT